MSLFEILNRTEMSIIGECLRAAVCGPFFPDWEFETLLGFSRAELSSFAERWPVETDGRAERIVIAVLNTLVGYPHGHDHEWAEYVSVTPAVVEEILLKLAPESLA
jgi:hypothetical protein